MTMSAQFTASIEDSGVMDRPPYGLRPGLSSIDTVVRESAAQGYRP